MSLKSAIIYSHAAQVARSNSLLPFLYQTQTLLSLPSTQRSNKLLSPVCSIHRNFTSTPRKRNGAYRRPERNALDDTAFVAPRSTPTSDPDIPFENVVARSEARQTKPSTITASEKAVFDRIFEDIDQSKSDEHDVELDEQDAEAGPFEDLNSIFDAAIQQLRLREELAAKQRRRPNLNYERAIERAVDLEDSPLGARTFFRPLKLANGVVLGAGMETEESEEVLRVASNDHRALVSGMLEHADSDVQIWNVLEKEVFNLVKQLDDQIKMEEKARKAQEREEKKAAKEKKSLGNSEHSPSKEVSPTTAASVALPTNVLFSTIQNNYADYLLSALRLLRRYHPTSFYALHLLPTVKRLGPISYALGASISLYNEILFLKWTQFSDLHGMADLMQEMIDQGIEMNEVTMVFIRRLGAKRNYGRMGRFGPIVRKWWDMRGNLEGWKRVSGIYESTRKEQRERSERERRVKGKGYEGEGEIEEDG